LNEVKNSGIANGVAVSTTANEFSSEREAHRGDLNHGRPKEVRSGTGFEFRVTPSLDVHLASLGELPVGAWRVLNEVEKPGIANSVAVSIQFYGCSTLSDLVPSILQSCAELKRLIDSDYCGTFQRWVPPTAVSDTVSPYLSHQSGTDSQQSLWVTHLRHRWAGQYSLCSALLPRPSSRHFRRYYRCWDNQRCWKAQPFYRELSTGDAILQV